MRRVRRARSKVEVGGVVKKITASVFESNLASCEKQHQKITR